MAAAETRTQAAPNAAAQPQRPAGRRHGTPTRLGRPCAAVPPRPGGAAAQKRSQKRPQTRPHSSRSGTTGTDAGHVHSDGGRLASSRARHQYTSQGTCRSAQSARHAVRLLETVRSVQHVGEAKTRRKAPARRRRTCEHTRPGQRVAAPLDQPFGLISKRVLRGCSWPVGRCGRTCVPVHAEPV